MTFEEFWAQFESKVPVVDQSIRDLMKVAAEQGWIMASQPKVIATTLIAMNRESFNAVVDALIDRGQGPMAADLILSRDAGV